MKLNWNKVLSIKKVWKSKTFDIEVWNYHSNFFANWILTHNSRPWSLHSWGTSEYIAIHNKEKEAHYPHPLLEQLTHDSYWIVLYQEQVMKVMRILWLMSWRDTADIRRLISKSEWWERFDMYKEKYLEGTRKQNVPDEVALEVWSAICTFGSFAFNKCLSGDTLVETENWDKITVKELYMKFIHEIEKVKKWEVEKFKPDLPKIKSFNVREEKEIYDEIREIMPSGKKEIFEIELEDGRKIRTSMDHKFLTKTKEMKSLKEILKDWDELFI